MTKKSPPSKPTASAKKNPKSPPPKAQAAKPSHGGKASAAKPAKAPPQKPAEAPPPKPARAPKPRKAAAPTPAASPAPAPPRAALPAPPARSAALERFVAQLRGDDTDGTRMSDLSDTLFQLSFTDRAVAAELALERLRVGVDWRAIFATRYLGVSEAPAVLRAHVEGGLPAREEILACSGWLEWEPEAADVVVRAARLAETAPDEQERMDAIDLLATARGKSTLHRNAVRAAIESCLLDPVRIVRWKAYRALLDERGVRELVVEPDAVLAAVEADASAGLAAWRTWRGGLSDVEGGAEVAVAFLRATDAWAAAADRATCVHDSRPCLTFHTFEQVLLRCTKCGQWTWQDWEYTYLVGGHSEEDRPATDVDLDGAIARVTARLESIPRGWLVSRPGRAHFSWSR